MSTRMTWAGGVAVVSLCGISGGAWVSAAWADLPALSPTAVASGAVTSREYGIEFVTVGSPRNAPFHGADHTTNPYYIGSGFEDRGTINEPYRMARTELTTSKWAEFVNAFAPHWEGAANDFRMTGRFVGRDAQGHYFADPNRANDPATWMSWLSAAAYCNWLCNGQRTDADAFRTGAYDLRGINLANPAPLIAPITMNANAAFRLPSIDEWHKAAFFDPNRYGLGQQGWWLFPTTMDRPPASGFVENGGETNAGAPFQANRPYPVAEYPTIQSPWGLFDLSGGVPEYLSDAQGVDAEGIVYYNIVGSHTFTDPMLVRIFDQPGLGLGGTPYHLDFTGAGIRLFATIPTPSAAGLLIIMVFIHRRKRS